MFQQLKRISGQEPNRLWRGIACMLVDILLYGAAILVFFNFLSRLLNQNLSVRAALWETTAVALIYLARMFTSSNSYRLVMAQAYEITSNIRLNIARHFKNMTLGFFLKKNLGNLSNAILQDTNLLDFLLSHIFIRLVRDVFFALVMFSIMAWLDLRLFMFSLVPITLAIPFFLVARRKAVTRGGERLNSIDKADTYILEYIQGIAVMKSFGMVGSQNLKLLNQLRQLAKDSLVIEGLVLGWGVLFSLSIELGLPLLFLILLHEYAGGAAIGLDSIFFIISYILMYLSIFDVMQYGLLAQYMINAAGRIEGLLNSPALDEPERPEEPIDYAIEFSDVSFGYGNKKALHEISFRAEEKSMTALVGHSGAGKSTIANLIALFWNNYDGEIKIGGAEVRRIGPEKLMNLMSFVFQDVYLFNDTIYNNILCGRKDATEEEVMEAARKAHCHEFISGLPEGYRTVISEGGGSLSGGQKQRISIARAILKNAPIIILDEATTSLDPINEFYIQEAVNNLVREKTVIIIAHRLYTIRDADRIIVLEKGRIADMGTHPELAGRCREYCGILGQKTN